MAIKDYDKAIQLKPEDSYVYKERGSYRLEIEDYKRAINDYTQAIELEPDDAYLYSYRGDVYYAIRHYVKTVEDYNQAINIEPEEAYFYRERAYCRLQNNDDKGTLEDLKKAAALYIKQENLENYHKILEEIENMY
ncbi:tetratricopeptide repeat protein [Nostoc sp. UHCC 0702]|nr:tetratricopeptide repeat protein [Nostoc sp. UHCC 0702]